MTKPISYALAFSIVALGLVGTVLLAAKTYRTVWPADGALPVPAPIPADYGTGPKFAAAMTGENAPGDAAYLRDVFLAAARGIEEDGASESARLTSRSQIVALVDRLGHFATIGRTQGRYDELPAIVGGLFDEHFPTKAGAFTPADRAKAVELFDALAIGVEHVP